MTTSLTSCCLALMIALPRLAQSQTVRVTDAEGKQRRCEVADKPKRLPTISALFDSVTLVERIATAGASDSLLVSLVFDREGRMASLRSIDGASLTTEVSKAIRTTLWPQDTPGPWALRVRLTLTPTLQLRAERSVYCPPEPRRDGPNQPTESRIEVRAGDRLPQPGGKIRIRAEVSLDERGSPTSVNLLQSTGLRELDDQVVRQLQTNHFYPALIDGLPISSWYRTDGGRLRF